MHERLLHALVRSRNEAADDVLLEAARVGSEPEQRAALNALLQRQTLRGLCGIVSLDDRLPEGLQLGILRNVRLFHHALRECGRSEHAAVRLAAMRMIALGRQGKLAYVLSENLHEGSEALSKAAAEAMVALARWVATESRGLQEGGGEVRESVRGSGGGDVGKEADGPARQTRQKARGSRFTGFGAAIVFIDVLGPPRQRPEIEAAVARAMNVHRGRHGQDLLRAGLLLCDHPGSRTLAILGSTRHGGQSSMVRRLQQPPAASTSRRSCWAPATAGCGRTSRPPSPGSKSRRFWRRCSGGRTGSRTTTCGSACSR